MKLFQTVVFAFSFAHLTLGQGNSQSFQLDGTTFEYEALNTVEAPEALLVLFNGGDGNASKILPETKIPDTAVAYKIKTIGIDQSELFLSDSTYFRIRTIIEHVMQEEGITQNLFMGGFSLGGYTSIRFTEMATEKADLDLVPNAVFAIDPPLDHLAFVDYCLREIERECPNEAAIRLGKAEANWILNYYQQHFGSFNEDKPAYIEHSCFTADQGDGGNGSYLKNIPINLIHEIDIMWLITERCRDLSDTNAFIGSKFINFLIGLGNQEAIITTTTRKGYRADGRRHPHSWSIAEPVPTLDWLSKYIVDE